MPRHSEPDEPEDDALEDDEITPGDAEEISDFQDMIDDYGWLDGLDYLDDVTDYPEDEDWYEET